RRACARGGQNTALATCDEVWRAMEREIDTAKEIDMIQVRLTGEGDPFVFEVVVSEGKGETRHHVTMSRETCERLAAGKHTPERCLEAALRVLLDPEPTETHSRPLDANG